MDEPDQDWRSAGKYSLERTPSCLSTWNFQIKTKLKTITATNSRNISDVSLDFVLALKKQRTPSLLLGWIIIHNNAEAGWQGNQFLSFGLLTVRLLLLPLLLGIPLLRGRDLDPLPHLLLLYSITKQKIPARLDSRYTVTVYERSNKKNIKKKTAKKQKTRFRFIKKIWFFNMLVMDSEPVELLKHFFVSVKLIVK